MKLVIDLQQKALDSNIAITNLLRIAYSVASKLDIKNFKEWIYYELNGYSNKESLPEYRFISGQCKYFNPYHGWCDILVTNKSMIKLFQNVPMYEKISAIEKLSEEEITYRELPSDFQEQFAMKNHGMIPRVVFYSQEMLGILDSVRTNVLDWSLALEKEGILGEDMIFNENEKKAAENITIYNINGTIENSQLQQGSNNSINFNSNKNDIEIIKSILLDIKEIISNMPDDDNKGTIQADIATIEEQLKSPKPRMTVIKEVLNSARNVIEGMFGSLIASYPEVAQKFSLLFGQ